MEFLDDDVDIKDVKAEVIGPYGKVDAKMNLKQHGGKGTFTPMVVGMHQVNCLFDHNTGSDLICLFFFAIFNISSAFFQLIVTNEGERVVGAPVYVRVAPELTNIEFPGIDPCAIGSIVEVLVS